MPMLRLNATPDGLTGHAQVGPLPKQISRLSSHTGPAIIMLHGYKYAPQSASHCPHRKIFSETAKGWPARLGFGQGQQDEGIGIGLGWYARGSLRSAHAKAGALGRDLAMIVALLRAQQPLRPVHVIAHSLGSETALAALPYMRHGAVDRMILLTGASYAKIAVERLRSPAGRSAEILNVTSRENDLFDAAFERLVPCADTTDNAIGAGIDAHNVVNLQIDCAQTLAGLDRLGHLVAPPQRRVCHWSAYQRPGVMEFYSTFLRRPEELPLERLRQNLPAGAAPRWSRLLPAALKRPAATDPLPLAQQRLASPGTAAAILVGGKLENEPTC